MGVYYFLMDSAAYVVCRAALSISDMSLLQFPALGRQKNSTLPSKRFRYRLPDFQVLEAHSFSLLFKA